MKTEKQPRKKALVLFLLALLSAWSVFFLRDAALEEDEQESREQRLVISAEQLAGVQRLVIWQRKRVEYLYGAESTEQNHTPAVTSVVPDYFYRRVRVYYGMNRRDEAVILMDADRQHAMQLLEEEPEQSDRFTASIQGDTLFIYYPRVVAEGRPNRLQKIHLPRQINRIHANTENLIVTVAAGRQDAQEAEVARQIAKPAFRTSPAAEELLLDTLHVRSAGLELNGDLLRELRYHACAKNMEDAAQQELTYTEASFDVFSDNLTQLHATLHKGMDVSLRAPKLEKAVLKSDAEAMLRAENMRTLGALQWQPLQQAERDAVKQPCIAEAAQEAATATTAADTAVQP